MPMKTVPSRRTSYAGGNNRHTDPVKQQHLKAVELERNNNRRGSMKQQQQNVIPVSTEPEISAIWI